MSGTERRTSLLTRGSERRRWTSFAVAASASITSILLSVSASAQPGPATGVDVPAPPPGFRLTWKDDFNGPAGARLSPGKWIYDIGTGYGCIGCPDQWGTFEIETMTDSTDNVSLDGEGNLLITPIRDLDGNWTSGRIETRKASFTAGESGILRVEAAIQLPQTGFGLEATGYWPAFWMLGAPFRGNYLNWPGIGEIDIMESINGRPSSFAVFHCGTNPGGPCNESSGIGLERPDATLQDGFHVYAMELDKSVQPNELRFYVDGDNFHTILSTQVPEQTWLNATDHAFFIILNVAIGGAFPWAECTFFPHEGGCNTPGAPFPQVDTSNTVSGMPMKVAYVAVYNSGK